MVYGVLYGGIVFFGECVVDYDYFFVWFVEMGVEEIIV